MLIGIAIRFWHGSVGPLALVAAAGLIVVQRSRARAREAARRRPGPLAAGAPTAATDPLEQVRALAELRDAGVLTEAEFEAKKAQLLRRA